MRAILALLIAVSAFAQNGAQTYPAPSGSTSATVDATAVKNAIYVQGAGTNTITGTTSQTFAAYADGQIIRLCMAAAANTSTVTVNFNSIGAVALTKNGGTALASGDLAASSCYLLTYRTSLVGFDMTASGGMNYTGTAPIVVTGSVLSAPTAVVLPSVANSSTGTTLNYFASQNSTGQAQTSSSLDKKLLGLVTAGAGTTGSATLATDGIQSCVFDNSTKANNYVILSPDIPGACRDSGVSTVAAGGTSLLLSQQIPLLPTVIVGETVSTNSGAGTYAMKVYPTPIDTNPPPVIPINGLAAEYFSNWGNYTKYSNTFTNAFWSTSNASVTVSCSVSCTAPDGTATATEFIEAATSSTHKLNMGAFSASAFTQGDTYSVSWYVKANTRNWAYITVGENSVVSVTQFFNVSTCTVGTTSANVSQQLAGFGANSVGNGWCRIWITYTQSTAQFDSSFVGNPAFTIGISSADNTLSYTGNGANSVLIWGSQINEGSQPSPYVATTDLTSVADQSGNGNTAAINGASLGSLLASWLVPQGIRLMNGGGNPGQMRLELPVALSTSMQTVVIVADYPAWQNGQTRPWLGSSIALAPHLSAGSSGAVGSGIGFANFNLRPQFWYNTVGTNATTASLITNVTPPAGPAMLAWTSGGGVQDRLYVNGTEYTYYAQNTTLPLSTAGLSRAGASAAVPQIGGDSINNLYLSPSTSIPANIYFAAVYNTRLTTQQQALIYDRVKSWLARKGVILGVGSKGTSTTNMYVSDGDSITQGLGATSYAMLIQAGTYPTTPTFGTNYNIAIAGQTAYSMSHRGDAGGIASTFQSGSPRNVVTLMGGTNDLGTTCGVLATPLLCAQTVVGFIAKEAQDFRSAGYKVGVLPMIDRSSCGSTISVAANVATVTSCVAHGKSVGNSITVASSGTGALDGTYTITAVTAGSLASQQSGKTSVISPSFTFTTAGVANGTYGAFGMTVTGITSQATMKNTINQIVRQTWRSFADFYADTSISATYDPSLNSSAAFVSLVDDGAAINNSSCNGVSCWLENSPVTNTHPSNAGHLMLVQPVRNAINAAYSAGPAVEALIDFGASAASTTRTISSAYGQFPANYTVNLVAETTTAATSGTGCTLALSMTYTDDAGAETSTLIASLNLAALGSQSVSFPFYQATGAASITGTAVSLVATRTAGTCAGDVYRVRGTLNRQY